AGSRVLEGKITSGSIAKLLRGNDLIFEGPIGGLKRFKDDAKEVASGFECGIRVDGYQDFQQGDVIEAYQVRQAWPVISGVHALIFARDADKVRAFFRDVLGFSSVDAGGGWLIFALPPAEL